MFHSVSLFSQAPLEHGSRALPSVLFSYVNIRMTATFIVIIYILCVCMYVCVCLSVCLCMWYVILEHEDKGRANMETSDSNNEDGHSYFMCKEHTITYT